MLKRKMKFHMRVFALGVAVVIIGTYITFIRPVIFPDLPDTDNDYIDVDLDSKDSWESDHLPVWAADRQFAESANESSRRIEKSDLRRRVPPKERIKAFVEAYQVDLNYQLNGTDPWKLAASWVTSRQIIGDPAPELGAVLKAMATHNITSADVGYKGTQLKLTLVLDNSQTVVFKPQWYPRNYIIRGKPYEGHDRHNAEIVAFHLSRILGLRRVPLTVGRIVDLEKDILPVATERLRNTFFTNGSNTCFYGKCLYCKNQENGVCANGTLMEGAVILWLPKRLLFQQYRHPWARTYKPGKQARWEYDPEHYCSDIQRSPLYNTGPLLMDVMDTAVFDFIIGNADRHHFEVIDNDPASMLIMFDNGKSFGNAAHDENTILAPIDQCKRIRSSTLNRLRDLTDGVLSHVIRHVTSADPIAPLLSSAYYEAMERRLAIVLHSIDTYIRQSFAESVIVSDGYS
jgi:hypothetical protein